MFIKACIYKQALSYFLMLAFINTTLFPSLLLVTGKAKTPGEVIATSEVNTSLTEYILEDCLQMQDITPHEQEKDINEFENSFDEVDLLTYMAATMAFLPYAKEILRGFSENYPLVCSCFGSATPPPEFI